MGIESDQLVFDYLSRVGDLAHRTPMTAAERARLVSDLRGRIDQQRRAEGGAESKAAVRKILARLGRPEEIVSGRGSGSDAGAGAAPREPNAPLPPGYGDDDRFGEDTKVSLWKRATSARGSGASSPP
ncbi:MAG: HAAS signaling domain-containing protein, partial [Streptomyces sp.]